MNNVKKLTDSKFLNLFQIDAKDRKGNDFKYYFASRGKGENLKYNRKEDIPDGVMIYAVLKDDPSKIVLVKQYRYPINDYIYEMPAGLVDEGESYANCAIREFKEETGMTLKLINDGKTPMSRPFYTTVGLTDEAVCIYYGYAEGTPSKEWLEATETINTEIVDRKEALRILKEERVAMKCALLLMQFINSSDENPFGFLDLE